MEFSDFWEKISEYMPADMDIDKDTKDFIPNYSYRQLKKNADGVELVRGRCVCLLLYPDDPSHMRALLRLNDWRFKYAAILHNWDKVEDSLFADEIDDDFLREQWLKENESSDGKYKKAHIHAVLSFSDAKTNTAVAKMLQINSNYVQVYTGEKILDIRLRYLCHMDNPDKVYYDPELATGILSSQLRDLQHELARPDNLLLLDAIDFLQSKYEKGIQVTEWKIVKSVDVVRSLVKNGYGRIVVKSNLKKTIDEWRFDHNRDVSNYQEEKKDFNIDVRLKKLENLLNEKDIEKNGTEF